MTPATQLYKRTAYGYKWRSEYNIMIIYYIYYVYNICTGYSTLYLTARCNHGYHIHVHVHVHSDDETLL